ncbi:protein phosphatase 1 regulatory inhibitor subunit 16B-like [Limulus polyphemus]|uniref:Protein phosphatase 1 regulatory inhibitor subunit 16B-like n=1 Tax=Limulus polyphemus TaxID=6850 RepID=A0ABM1SNT9_LIMPO|nr:protein phosphatase 1 regulatory inhibitor subunit 16B-like [Limulus polyphemus]XP_022245295.1 protein phosphatase 1 regulatory inhibitor subunit 16B-like [Limulus polyphemus]XP_022245296.1 protein phosphatase 1 regulatory inhibitor subunit 16B-like [Limulus polyphemus]XP_022245297.1 protein phosphatase 1 regulatory inhibitor subunit 16B-like [Limulus polyphemus]
MAEHEELVAEMALFENISAHERVQLGRKRRQQQLKRWSQNEKDFYKMRKKSERTRKPPSGQHNIRFVPSVILLESSARNDIEEVRRLLKSGVDPDSTNEDGLTAVHQCCIDSNEEMIKLLFEFGANVNATDHELWTPLHAAAACGNLNILKLVIEKGGDLLAVNSDGNMPYDICENNKTLSYIEFGMTQKGITQEMIDQTRKAPENKMLNDLKNLAKKGESLEFRDEQGATPLHIAAANDYLSVVEFLLDQNVTVDAVDNDLWRPIHAAACWCKYPGVLEMLVHGGADLSATTKNGETPFDICEDPELKMVLTELKTQMETDSKTHVHDIRRSQSQNSRSQSVRRTSIRDKNKISRREALEEAMLWQEKEKTSENHQGDDQIKEKLNHKESEKCKTPENDVNLVVTSENMEKTGETYESFRFKSNQGVKVDGLEENSCRLKESVNEIQKRLTEEVDLRAGDGPVSQSDLNVSPRNYSSTSVSESVKVEIRVTVNGSPSSGPETLSDLNNYHQCQNQVPHQDKDKPFGEQLKPTFSDAPKWKFKSSEVIGKRKKHRFCIVM